MNELQDDDVSIVSLFGSEERRRTLEEQMTQNAILMKWSMGSIDGVTALQAMIEFDVLDYDKMLGAYADIVRKGKG